MHTYLDELNQPQKEAVSHLNGPLMIVAGAGRGKTKVEYDNYPAGEDEPDDVVGNSTTLNWGPNYQATIRLGFCIK